MRLDDINSSSVDSVRSSLLACCGSDLWADRILSARPYRTKQALHSKAEDVWLDLQPEEWLQAFLKHPKIGENSSAKWSAQEQEGMSQATITTAQAMVTLNLEYERAFGWIFIVCATGRSAEEMLSLIQQRLHNHPDQELQIAVAEQAKIMHLRLDKLLAE